jgi:hypothetical protein
MTRSPDLTRIVERLDARGSQLRERSVDRAPQTREQFAGRHVRRDVLLAGECGLLLLRELLPARVRQQPIETAGHMPQVKSDRRGAAGGAPQGCRIETGRQTLGVLQRLKQCVRYGLKLPVDSFDRTAKPDLGPTHRKFSRSQTQALRREASVNAKRLEISRIFLPPSRALVLYELIAPDHRHPYAFDVVLDAPRPGCVELDTGDRCQDIHPVVRSDHEKSRAAFQ